MVSRCRSLPAASNLCHWRSSAERPTMERGLAGGPKSNNGVKSTSIGPRPHHFQVNTTKRRFLPQHFPSKATTLPRKLRRGYKDTVSYTGVNRVCELITVHHAERIVPAPHVHKLLQAAELRAGVCIVLSGHANTPAFWGSVSNFGLPTSRVPGKTQSNPHMPVTSCLDVHLALVTFYKRFIIPVRGLDYFELDFMQTRMRICTSHSSRRLVGTEFLVVWGGS
jgi:hypothetical protein